MLIDVAFVGLVVCGVQTQSDEDPARRSFDESLSLIDAGNSEEALVTTASVFRKRAAAEEFRSKFEVIRV